MLLSPRTFRPKVRCCFTHFDTSGAALPQQAETRLNGARLLRPLRHHAGLPVEVIPSSHTSVRPSLGPFSLGSPISSGSRGGVSSECSVVLHPDRCVCPLVPCVSLTEIPRMNTQLGFGQSSPHHRRRGFPTWFRYLTHLAFLTTCSYPLTPFGAR